jgi:hypothetical protein
MVPVEGLASMTELKKTMKENNDAKAQKEALPPVPDRWAYFRFSIIGPLLAAPPDLGQLKTKLQEQAEKNWPHPVTGLWVKYGYSTLESWYYAALAQKWDPVQALRRKIRSDSGQHPSLKPALRQQLTLQ